MPHFPRCERTQHKIIMAESGSKQSFAAAIPKVYYADKAGIYIVRLVPDQLA